MAKNKLYCIRDKGNYLIKWLSDPDDAKQYIKQHDPDGSKGYHILVV